MLLRFICSYIRVLSLITVLLLINGCRATKIELTKLNVSVSSEKSVDQRVKLKFKTNLSLAQLNKDSNLQFRAYIETKNDENYLWEEQYSFGTVFLDGFYHYFDMGISYDINGSGEFAYSAYFFKNLLHQFKNYPAEYFNLNTDEYRIRCQIVGYGQLFKTVVSNDVFISSQEIHAALKAFEIKKALLKNL